MSPGIFLRTPSFPFPHISVESGTPVGTPDAHVPFTTLSPTGQPSIPVQAKLAKGKVAKDFMESGYVKASSTNQLFPEGSQADGPPSAFEIAIQIQSELGLAGWWSQTTQVLKESFNAERATLAVPSDITEIENIPWAQLATFNADEEDSMSNTTTEPQSATSSLNEVLGQENTFVDRKRDRDSSSNLRALALKTGANFTGRPKLESRHSYAGHPVKYHSIGPEAFSSITPSTNRPTPTRPGSQALLSSFKSSEETLRLSAEQLRPHDVDESSQGPLSEDTNMSSKGSLGQVLKNLQPLESDIDPLITTAGVGRVLNNSSATILTRKYLDRQGVSIDEDKKRQNLRGKISQFHKPRQHSSSGRIEVKDALQTSGGKALRPRQPRNNTASTTKDISAPIRLEGPHREGMSNTPPYEDFEQIPGTPWAQSPAPSPAAAVDPEENPFFSTSTTVDDEAFSNHPPQYQQYHYASGQQIEAIGLDKSSSIIQIPLIHPTAALSQPQRAGRLREDRRTKDRKGDTSTIGPWHQRYVSSERSRKRIPLAILSILAPKTPYPIELVDCLNQLSPLLATSFYAARQHSNLQSELAAVTRGRDRSSARLNLHDITENVQKTLGRQPAREHNFSPSTSNSTDSTVESVQMDEQDESKLTSDELEYEEKDEGDLERSQKYREGRYRRVEKQNEGRFDPTLDHTPSNRGVYRKINRKDQSEEHVKEKKMIGLSGASGVENGTGGEERVHRQARVSSGRTYKDQAGRVGQMSRDGYSPTQSLQSLEQTSNDDIENHETQAQSKRHSSQQYRLMHPHGANSQTSKSSLSRPTSVSSSSSIHPSNSDTSEISKEPSLSMLKTMIDNGATQQFIADPDDGNLVWANSKFQAYRSSVGESIQDQLWNHIYPKDRKAFKKEWTNALQTGEQLSHQVRLRRFDSQYRWFHIKFLPIKGKLGITKYWHGQAMDIHDLHEAEVKAAKSREKSVSEAKYRAIANSLPVIVFAASVPAGMTFANTQWLSYSGQTLDEALGFGFLDHVHPEDLVKCRFPGFETSDSVPISANELHPHRRSVVREDSNTSSAADSEGTSATDKTVKARLKRPYSPLADVPIPNELLRGLAQDGIILCAKDGQGNLSITTELRLKSHEGEYRWHLVQGCYIESVNFGQGDAQWFIACTDISSQKHTEAKMEQTNTALEVSNAALGKEMHQKMGYLSAMSHEIRTPLNGIIGNLQFLINSGLEESAAEWAHGAQEAAKGMHELINDILDLSKAEAKMLKLLSHWFNPRSLMEQVVDMLNSKASEKKLELCYECSDDVPKSIRGDSGRIRQVLLNLVGNAVKFTKTGEIIVRCDLMDQFTEHAKSSELGQNEIFVRWTVTDTGSGFSEVDKKLLFKPYSQIKSKNTRDIGGTGLGLTLCKTMVDLHGGEITASGQPGVGSVFTFFARFRSRKDSAMSQQKLASGPPSPALSTTLSTSVTEPSLHSAHIGSPALLTTKSQDSPALMSDSSSSAPSIRSTDFQRSLRSSVSTTDSDMPMKLTLPPSVAPIQSMDTPTIESPLSPTSTTPMPRHAPTIPFAVRPTPISPKSAPVTTTKAIAVATTSVSTNIGTTSIPTRSSVANKGATKVKGGDLDRASFRPPMLSVLVFCPPEKTRQITCDRIQSVAPRSAPCNITSKATIDEMLSLLQGPDPVKFTHVVLRSTSDNDIERLLKQILPTALDAKTCVILITDQDQVKTLRRVAPTLDFDELNKMDRMKLLLKPAHSHKLAKIFDPFNENAVSVDVPKEVKRREQQEQQKRSWEMFGKVLGYKRNRVMAVEDNPVQMKVRA